MGSRRAGSLVLLYGGRRSGTCNGQGSVNRGGSSFGCGDLENLETGRPTRARSRSKPRPVTSTPQGRDVGETQRVLPRLGSATEHKTDEPYNFLTPGPDGLPSPAPAGVGVGCGLLLRGPTGEWANPGLGTRPYVPYSEEPIRYLSDRVNDPVARLQDRIDRGLARLDFEAEHGYLKSVLKQLDVAVSSQTLVFSKSSFQYRKISPQTPRALYYNDNVYVGWVKDGHSLEIASFDPDQGAIFYLLEQQPSDQPAFVRATLIAPSATSPPGRGECPAFVRSIYTRPSGTQATYTSSYVSGLESPLKERFGGWYVTGTHGRQTHMGNVFVVDREHPERLDVKAGTTSSGSWTGFPRLPT